MDSSASTGLSRSFERHLRAKNLSDGTVASYLVGVRQFTAFLQPYGRELTQATRADLEAVAVQPESAGLRFRSRAWLSELTWTGAVWSMTACVRDAPTSRPRGTARAGG